MRIERQLKAKANRPLMVTTEWSGKQSEGSWVHWFTLKRIILLTEWGKFRDTGEDKKQGGKTGDYFLNLDDKWGWHGSWW